jgi:ketosteroid isomerase-like protein
MGVGLRACLGMALAAFTTPVPAHELVIKKAATELTTSAKSAAATVDAFHSALRRGHTGSAAALMADDALIFEAGGVERTKAEYAARHLAADAAFSRSVSSSVTSRTGGSAGKLAWIASEGRTTGEYKGKPVDQLTTETVLLRRTRGGWRIVHIHWSSAPK